MNIILVTSPNVPDYRPQNCTTREQLLHATTYFLRYVLQETKCHIVGSENIVTLKHCNVNTRAFSCHCLVSAWLANEEWPSFNRWLL